MLTIRKLFGICFSTRATLARSTRIDGQEPSPGAFGLVRASAAATRPRTKYCKEVLWSPWHFAASCGGGRTRYCRSILGSREPRFNLSTWLAVPYYPRPEGRGFTAPRIGSRE